MRILRLTIGLLLAGELWPLRAAEADPLPAGFVHVDQVAPGVQQDLRYATSANFVGVPIDGYESGRAILTREAATALRAVQTDLAGEGFALKIFDAYRPQRAVHHFVRWARDRSDVATQSEYYPGVAKPRLFAEGYLALESGHSRGSTLDVTLMKRGGNGAWVEVDMGTPFDFFGPESAPCSDAVTAEQKANRSRLRAVMAQHGFEPYDREWWHFTLRAEPFAETYFDFLVQ
ncbi:M15 family metallopeptidase [Synoicihabitans lomoniglobus]|uniref:D-alanyl-D-alanine dipeptidase n=1 Tax=Synoicihabitans lomoniglobus TaxID=2909285 RepID=A0AAF0CSI1_9BACT|nr:M15 family metallopeptidase [Opitutaceae bacterium LMO-M01]WED67250.1 M15 family metallopeptidase [Opitutaceae bacterium LMO-M01]